MKRIKNKFNIGDKAILNGYREVEVTDLKQEEAGIIIPMTATDYTVKYKDENGYTVRKEVSSYDLSHPKPGRDY